MNQVLKDHRMESIVNSAVGYLNRHDLSSLTIRKLAAESGFSVGHIHHHFSSVEELKARALKKMTRSVLEILNNLTYTDHRHLLERFLLIDQSHYPNFVAVLREFRVQANLSLLIREAFNDSMRLVHRDICKIIVSGIRRGELVSYDCQTMSKKAWKIIAFIQGLDSLMGIQLIEDNDLTALDFIRDMLDAEVPRKDFKIVPRPDRLK
ncbi:TetR family transcriptional regulator [Enterobacter bugandensis]|nr:TetR family transcriptional regulator [Enterobacter bugandensis]